MIKPGVKLYIITVAGFLAVAAITKVLLTDSKVEFTAKETEPPAMLILDAEYQLKGSKGMIMKSHFQSAKGKYPTFNEFAVEQPRFVLFKEGREAWRLSSESGTLLRDEEHFVFQRGFRAESAGAESSYVFTADEATLLKKDNKVVATSNVALIGDGVQLKADRMVIEVQ